MKHLDYNTIKDLVNDVRLLIDEEEVRLQMMGTGTRALQLRGEIRGMKKLLRYLNRAYLRKKP